MTDPIPFIFIAVFLFVISMDFVWRYYADRLSPKFINDAHRQLDRERKEAWRQHKPSKHITDKIKALVRAELEKSS